MDCVRSGLVGESPADELLWWLAASAPPATTTYGGGSTHNSSSTRPPRRSPPPTTARQLMIRGGTASHGQHSGARREREQEQQQQNPVAALRRWRWHGEREQQRANAVPSLPSSALMPRCTRTAMSPSRRMLPRPLTSPLRATAASTSSTATPDHRSTVSGLARRARHQRVRPRHGCQCQVHVRMHQARSACHGGMAAWMQPLHGQHGGVATTTPAGNSATPPPRPVGSAVRDFGKLLFNHSASVSILAARGRSRSPRSRRPRRRPPRLLALAMPT